MDGALIVVIGVVILIAGYILFRVVSKNVDGLREQVQELSEANDALKQQQEATNELLTEAENRVSELASEFATESEANRAKIQELSEANDALKQQQEATNELLTEAENRVSELASEFATESEANRAKIQELSEANDALKQEQETTKELLAEAENRSKNFITTDEVRDNLKRLEQYINNIEESGPNDRNGGQRKRWMKTAARIAINLVTGGIGGELLDLSDL